MGIVFHTGEADAILAAGLDRARPQNRQCRAVRGGASLVPAWARSPGMATPTGGNRYDTMNPSTLPPSTLEGTDAIGREAYPG
jgi:hypothetical protein